MSNSNDPKPQQEVTQSQTPADLESQAGAIGNGAIYNIVQRWKRENLLDKGLSASRGSGLVFSFLAFVIMASNKHGDWKDYNKYEEYRYVLAIAILSTLYTGLQVLRQVHELHTGKQMFPPQKLALIGFLGDQILAYLLMSATSSAVPLTNRMREGSNNLFTDASASAIAMEFFAFVSLALSSVASGYRLGSQSSI